jgi:hypothetical protein
MFRAHARGNALIRRRVTSVTAQKIAACTGEGRRT